MIIKQDKHTIDLICDTCTIEHSRATKHYKKMKLRPDGLFSSDFCNACWRIILNTRPEYREKMRVSINKRYASPEGEIMRSKISTSCKGLNSGDKNGMKRPEVQAKVSATRSKMMEDPTERAKYIQGSIDAHARGCYIGTKCGKTKWYDYEHSDGTIYKVQGTWELKYIEWLDKNNVKFECHRGRIPYVDGDITRNYYPDFYLTESQTYIDVKGDFWYNKSKHKFDLLFSQYPNLKLVILRKTALHSMGIDV